ncbi:MAG: filamentous hemagglutinin N-terminal domain-containing protein [Rivularia sp. (in: Bacteria)]|nr:filamentous hemagglutinin N-terminal domain-containing protein [Rivularia sp. MS3]
MLNHHSLVSLIWRSALIFTASGFAVVSGNSAFAQIQPDNTLGTQNSIVNDIDALNKRIDGGFKVDGNLFHSFEELNVSEGGSVYFANPQGVIDIFSRVTGNNPSNIFGKLGVLGDANLFLINPNGIIFGENASLDVGGSFVATTANGVEFGEQGSFSVSNPETPRLLNVSPSALFFNAVANQQTNSIESQAFLIVPNGKSLLLLGGNISPNAESTGNIVLNAGRLRASGGRVEIGGLGEPGKVDLNTINNQLSLGFPEDIERVDVSLLNTAEIDVTAGGAGDISIYARNIDILEGSDICAGIGADQACGGLNLDNGSDNVQAGDITLNATEKITIANPVSEVYNDVNPGAIGNSGNINITGKSVEINDGGRISASTFGKGNSGSINIFGEDTVSVKDSENNNTFIFNNVGFDNVEVIGDTGEINITTGSLFVTDGAQIQSLVYGEGNSGKITINARDQVSFDGRDTSDFPSSARSRVEVGGVGNGGGVDINTTSLSITNRAQITSVTQGRGNAGNISINAQNQVFLLNSDIISEVSEEGGVGEGGDINISTGSLLLQDGSSLLADVENFGKAGNITINVRERMVVEGEGLGSLANSTDIFPSQISTTVESDAVGEGGNIDISTNSLSIDDGGFISSRTSGKGNAGNIKLKASNEIIIKGIDSDAIPSEITATVGSDAVGDGGNIDITTGLLSLNDGGIISSDTSGDGKAGNLNIKTNNLTLRNNARVSATTFGSGDAGNLNIITDFFRLEGISQLGAITFGSGDAGTLSIKASETIQLIGSLDENRIQNGGLFASAIEGSGNGGDLILETDKLIVQDGAIISASNFQSTNQSPPGTGSPGNLSIDAGSVILDNKGSITTATSAGSDKNKGNISINVGGNLTSRDSTISTTSQQSSGGAINITAKDIRLFGDSDIATNVFSGTGGGGNINLTANTIIALDDSDILSFAGDGKGGDITFNTEAFFSKPLYNPSSSTNSNANSLTELDNNNRVDVNASGTVSGTIAGIPDTTFIQDNLTELPENQIDTNVLVANSCIVRSNQQSGTFFVTGAGGLPQNPSDAPLSNYSTGSVRSIPITSEKLPSSATQTWKIGDPIVEPSGAYQLPNGQIVLSRECF